LQFRAARQLRRSLRYSEIRVRGKPPAGRVPTGTGAPVPIITFRVGQKHLSPLSPLFRLF
jgi:hypothetical protein